MELIETQEQILLNMLRFDSYRTSENSELRSFYFERLRLGKIFVKATYEGKVLFCPSRFVGYKDNTMAKHIAFEYKSGSVTTPQISRTLGFPHKLLEDIEIQYLALCKEYLVNPAKKNRTYWIISNAKITQQQPLLEENEVSDFPEEVDQSKQYPEGAVKQILVNAHERNRDARKACINHYGLNCAVCNFNFEACYGAVGKDFIHVHHMYPLKLRDAEYNVNPINDLRPVCPNCHAMLHKSDPIFSIEEIRELIQHTKSTNEGQP